MEISFINCIVCVMIKVLIIIYMKIKIFWFWFKGIVESLKGLFIDGDLIVR